MKFVIATDNIMSYSKDKKVLDQVCKMVEEKGHTVVNCGVGPNKFQSRSQVEQGEFASVEIIGGIDGWTFSDTANGINKGYYNCKEGIFPVTSWYFPGTHKDKEGLKTYKMVRAHDAGPEFQSWYVGKTIAEFMKEHPKISIKGCDSASEIAEFIVNGKVNDTLEQEENEKPVKKTYKTMIGELLLPIQELVEVKFRGTTLNDQLHIKKCTQFKDAGEIVWADENLNMTEINPKGFNPNTTNTVIANYTNGSVGVRDNLLVELFGEKTVSLTAVKYVPRDEEYMINAKKRILELKARIKETERKREEAEREAERERKRQQEGRKPPSAETIAKKKAREAERERKRQEEELKRIEEESYDYDKNTTYGTIPITTREEAIDFALGKHYSNLLQSTEPIDLTVIGSNEFQVGKWIKIHNPRYGFVSEMIITSVAHTKNSPKEEWLTHLVCHGYYPVMGVGEMKTEKKELESVED